jgi:uncharacterized protein YlxP (DUF503 family)
VVVGRIELTLNIPAARSLKDKRRVIKSLIARIRNQQNAAVAEVGQNDKWQICLLGAAVVSNRSEHAHRLLSTIVKMVEREHEIVLIDYTIEIT